jgi:hypothetical protein
MSEMGHSQTFGESKRMSAPPLKADIRVEQAVAEQDAKRFAREEHDKLDSQ